MKEKELRKLSKCAKCKKMIGETGLPFFFKVTIERYGLDAKALQRQTGMEMMMGNVALAQVMGPNEDLAKRISGPKTVMICENCAGEKMIYYSIALGDEEEDEDE